MDKICIIVQMLSGGGAERTAANMSIDLSAGYEVHLIVFDGSNATYKHGGVVHDLGLPAKKGVFDKLVTIVKRINAVKKIKRTEGIKCSISLMEGANIVNIFSRCGEKTIISERNLISFFVKSRLHILLEKYILRRADYTIALSERVRQDLIKNFGAEPSKTVTIYNSVDISKFSKTEEDVGIASPYIVTMGRLTEQKAQWHIIRAFKEFLVEHPSYHLVILGKGELENDLKNLAKRLGIEGNVEFLGFQPNPHNIIIGSEFFVFSSMVEGLGSVILEALACGKAIISTDCDAGPREILAPDTDLAGKTDKMELARYGILVPVTQADTFERDVLELSDEEKILKAAMSILADDVDLRKKYEKLSNQRIADFSPEKISEAWKKVIE